MRVDPAAAMHAALLSLAQGSARGARDKAPFAPSASDAPEGAPPSAASSSPTPSVAMLVALAAQAPGLHRAPALRRAERGIDALSRLHRALASGTIPADTLADLRAWAGEKTIHDPDLAALLREVELRVLVELAKADR